MNFTKSQEYLARADKVIEKILEWRKRL